MLSHISHLNKSVRVCALTVNSALSPLYQFNMWGFGDLLWFLLADLAKLSRAVRRIFEKPSYTHSALFFPFGFMSGLSKNLIVFYWACSTVDCDHHPITTKLAWSKDVGASVCFMSWQTINKEPPQAKIQRRTKSDFMGKTFILAKLFKQSLF